MEQTKLPVSVYAEMTPNPAAMKFVADIVLTEDGDIAEFNTPAEAKGYSNLALALFEFPFVKQVFMTGNFVTVIKHDSIEWDFITMELREFIQNFLREGKKALDRIPEIKHIEDESAIRSSHEPHEIDHAIQELLAEYVNPAVESDGGSIIYKGFKDGTVSVVMRGSCAGCPSSSATLKGGIENLLKTHLPEVKEVVAEAI